MDTQQPAVEQMLGCRYVRLGENLWQRQILDAEGVVRAVQPANRVEYLMFRLLCGDAYHSETGEDATDGAA